jgi:CxxC motif-containing protein (DUF1111 family)
LERSAKTAIAFLCTLQLIPAPALAPKDPGPRHGAPGAGSPYLTLNKNELNLFSQAFLRFARPVSVSGTIEKGSGLGPTFSGNDCAMCHSQPTAGGSSPGLTSPDEPHPNPQVALATLDGATNSIPPFISTHAPVLVPRFLRHADGSPDGQVHAIYTVAGRADAKGCNLKQPDFAHEIAGNNVALRIPTPLYGLGLVEATLDATLLSNLASTAGARAKLGIAGRFNLSPNDGSIMRFGWKAHNKSLLMFAAEAANVEEGISNDLFPDERDASPDCIFNPIPEDSSHLQNPNPRSANFSTDSGTVSEMSSDIVNFAAFIRFLAPPKPVLPTPSTENGANLFIQVGCALCHSPTLRTGASVYSSLNQISYQPYSDFALHHMGPNLADGVAQGTAETDEFRTAPLWGIGKRLFFLHDGRTSDLLVAIEAHSSVSACQPKPDRRPSEHGCSSEADAVITNFKALTPLQIQDILNFLRSL